jgi:hypothetical protein
MLFQPALQIIGRTDVMPTVILYALQDVSVMHDHMLMKILTKLACRMNRIFLMTKLACRAGVPARHQPTPELSGDSR